MKMSHKMTFSLIGLILLMAFIVVPAMAQTPRRAPMIEATWTTDRNNDETADDPGWRVTFSGFLIADSLSGLSPVSILHLDGVDSAITTGVVNATEEVAKTPPPNTHEKYISHFPAALGDSIAVGLKVNIAGSPVEFQRVVLPTAGTGAKLRKKALKLLPKVKKLTNPNYYVRYGQEVTLTFEFADPVEPKYAATPPVYGNDAPVTDLHISDVSNPGGSDDLITSTDGWEVVSVNGNNRVTLRYTGARTAASTTIVVAIDNEVGAFAQLHDDVNAGTDATAGRANVTFDGMVPSVTAASVMIEAPSGFPKPADDVWDSTFVLTVYVNDDTNGSGPAVPTITGPANKVDIGTVGLAPVDSATSLAGTKYLVRITPKADRSTSAGEEVSIMITPRDKAGNVGLSVTEKVKLAQNTAPTPSEPPVRFLSAAPAGGNVEQGSTINVTFSSNPNRYSSDLLTNVSFVLLRLTNLKNPTTPLQVDGSGTRRSVTIPNDYATGAVILVISWKQTRTGDRGSGVQRLNYTVVTGTGTGTGTGTVSNAKTFEIPANKFVILRRSALPTPEKPETEKALTFPTVPPVGGTKVKELVWDKMPDLHDLFLTSAQNRGGALVLRRSTVAADNTGDFANPATGTVGISEIMWARDLGKTTVAAQAAGQWIEVHNLNNKKVKVQIYAQKGSDGLISGGRLQNTSVGDSLLGAPGGMVLDAIQNIRNDGNQNSGGWALKGKEGNSVLGHPFASMHRILPKDKPAYKNEAGSLYNNRRGTNLGSWSESGSAYVLGTTTHVPPVIYEYRGSPGDVNARTGIAILTPQGRTHKPASNNIVINEVGNRSMDDYDWLELRNASGSEINLRNYLITIVEAADDEKALVRFPANDKSKIPAGGVFLLLRTDPADKPDHPIAATGKNVDLDAALQEPGTRNSPVQYKVFSSLALPNDGEFVLMVRRPDNHENFGPGGHASKGTSEIGAHDLDKIVDIAGYDSGLSKSSYPNAVSSTELWPLYAFKAPNFTNNKFESNKVHYRARLTTKDDRSGVGADNNDNNKSAFQDIGWTGVGYRRAVAQNVAHGGTPGYPNDAFKAKDSPITNSVYISEIMYADDNRGSLPQWLELRNTSNTLGANLDNWRLVITNHDYKDEAHDALYGGKKGEASVLLRGLTIQPNSAVLITSRKGPRDDVHLPEGDIFIMFPTHRNTFGMVNASGDIFNSYGFTVALYANAHNSGKSAEWQLVDKIGNLAARRTVGRHESTNTELFDPPRWMWPHALTEDGHRISLARRNNLGGTKKLGFMIADGTEMSGWILSNMDDRTDLISAIYYGHREDISTPGQTVGQPLPVELSLFRPTLEDGKVTIQWQTESELDNAGFNILRSDTRDGEFTLVNEQMIQGKGTTAQRSTYKWVDTTAKPGVVYYYQIEDVSFAGEHNTLATTKLKGLISAKGKLTTQWGELKNLR